MPAQADTPTKTSRRSRRPSRKSAISATSQLPPSHDKEPSTDTATDIQPGQPMRILRRGEPCDVLDPAPTTQSGLKSPQTPPRPRSMYEGSTNIQQSGNGANGTFPNKRKTSGAPGRMQSGLASPMAVMHNSPISASQRESQTPNRNTATPTQAYAGPTFHASPAASSLPMPKLFSRSVPNVEKTRSLKTMMEQEAPGMTSGSEESASPENTCSSPIPKIREESPLDIFFRADREAKGRTESAPAMADRADSQARTSISPSRPGTLIRNHSLHSSVGGVFPLEMDGTVSDSSTGTPEFAGDIENDDQSQPSTSPASSRSIEAEQEEERKVKTLALKKLLFSPKPQSPLNASSVQRPPSSKLRKQLSFPNSPDHSIAPELPATPTPTRTYNPKVSAAGSPSQKLGYNPIYSPLTSKNASNQDLQKSCSRDAANTQSMEDDLRRILKLNVIGGNGATSLQS